MVCALVTCFCLLPGSADAEQGAFRYRKAKFTQNAVPAMTVAGFMDRHVISEKETLLDIARNYALGFNELHLLYPEMDPWLPPEGREIEIPRMWVLPPTRHEEVVINIPEMRLYRFFAGHRLVKTYPIGIGRQGRNTPVTDTRVAAMIKNPDWTVPAESREAVGRAIVPPGPSNPLGNRWIGLGLDHLGIHGTNFPWGIGRRVSQGCIRMYPEHITKFFTEVSLGTRVEIIYEPVKIGVREHQVFVEVHPDIHGIVDDMYEHAVSLLSERALLAGVDREELRLAAAEKNGVPAPVGIVAKP